MASGQLSKLLLRTGCSCALVWLFLTAVPVAAGPVDTAWAEAIDSGESAYRSGQKKVAEELFETALAEAEKFPATDVRRATTLNDLAVIYDETARYDKAEDCYTRALAIQEKVLGADSAEVATTLNNMANLYKDQRKYDKAEPMYQRVIGIYAKTKGPESEYMAMSYHNLAVLYEHEGRLKDAIPLYKNAIEIGDKTMGPDNDHVIDLVGNLAAAYDHEGQKASAKPLFHRYLQSVKGAVGIEDDGPAAIAALRKFAAAMRKEGQSGNADLVEKAVQYEAGN